MSNMNNSNKYRIRLSETYISILSSRDSITRLFKEYHSLANIEVVLDFNNIVFISRSAAQQLILERRQLESNKSRVVLENLSPFVNKMIQVADAKRKKNIPKITTKEFSTPQELEEFLISL